jgi:3-oxoacyl-[acyl-carrier-protein] synthase III
MTAYVATPAPGSTVVALGHYQPPRIVTNDDLAKIVDTNDEWIRSRVGISERRIAGDDDPLDVMAAKAGEQALLAAGLAPEDVDMVLLATCTAMDRSPNISARVAGRLGIPGPPAIDVNVACSGFSHALALADHSIRAGSATTALVIGAERLSDFTDWTDRSTCVLVADAAGAAVVRASETPEIGPVLWGSIPEMGDAVRIEGRNGTFQQSGQSVFRWATTELPQIALQVLERAGVDPVDLAGIVTHQANLRIIDPLAKKIGAPNAVVARDIIVSGNTSAASIPLALSKLVAERAIPKGGKVLLFAFGGGLSYAGQVITCP